MYLFGEISLDRMISLSKDYKLYNVHCGEYQKTLKIKLPLEQSHTHAHTHFITSCILFRITPSNFSEGKPIATILGLITKKRERQIERERETERE